VLAKRWGGGCLAFEGIAEHEGGVRAHGSLIFETFGPFDEAAAFDGVVLDREAKTKPHYSLLSHLHVPTQYTEFRVF